MLKNLILVCVFAFAFINLQGQSKEVDKLKKIIEKNDLDKARDYCSEKGVKMDDKNCIACFNMLSDVYFDKQQIFYSRSLFNTLIENQRFEVAMAYCKNSIKYDNMV